MAVVPFRSFIFSLSLVGLLFLACAIGARSMMREYELPRIVWMYWNTAEKPSLIRQIEERNRKMLSAQKGRWRIIYLNKETMWDYVRREDLPRRYSELIPQHQADWVRVYLISKYGGVWMDASIILNKPNALDELWSAAVAKKSDFTGFYTDAKFMTRADGVQVPLNIENWFFMAPARSRIVALWKAEYEKAIEMGFPVYRDMLLGSVTEKLRLDAFYPGGMAAIKPDDDVYFCQHLAAQRIFQRLLTVVPPVILLDSGDTMFKIRNRCYKTEPKSVDECSMNALASRTPEALALPYIKLTRHERATGIDISNFLEG